MKEFGLPNLGRTEVVAVTEHLTMVQPIDGNSLPTGSLSKIPLVHTVLHTSECKDLAESHKRIEERTAGHATLTPLNSPNTKNKARVNGGHRTILLCLLFYGKNILYGDVES